MRLAMAKVQPNPSIDLFSTKKQTMEEIKNMIKDYFIKLSNGTKNDIVDLIMK